MTAPPPDVMADLAAENARLKTDLRTALDRQAASSEILRVISGSPTEVQPVFDAIVLAAARLLRRDLAFILACDATTYWPVATAGQERLIPSPDPAPVAINTNANFPSRVVVTGKNLHLPDWSAIELPEYERMIHERLGINSALYLPLLRDGECIGLLGIAGKRAGIFSESEIALAESFRDQALIAIENARLFNETREALERQTATADILKVIASSPSDVQPVFEAIATSANRLIGGVSTAVMRFAGDTLHLAAFTPTNAKADAALQAAFPRPLAEFPPFMLVRDGETVQFADTESEEVPPVNRELARLRGYRSMLFTPLMSDGSPIGIISVTRAVTGAFPAHHIQLVQTFADQAVIAIENVRLFEEVQARTCELQESLEYQTATADVLNVISRSTTNVQPVFDAIAMSAARLFAPCETTLTTVHNGQLCWGATASLGRPVEAIERVKSIYPLPFDAESSPSARAILECRIIQISDVLAPDTPENTRRAGNAGEFRSITFVPLLREGIGIGTIILTHPEAGFKLSPKQLALVQTFADQAVIAIGNVRLFEEVQERTKELSQSLDDLRAAQDRLVQTEKLASLGQLTAGIAHEIKNPLNFVNNFSALSAELVDELNDTLKPAALPDKTRQEIDELTGLLKDNLQKVVQHGKRADSIVKNMLLHSREGSGEHRPDRHQCTAG